MSQNKTCQCGQPKITQSLPEGFSGTIRCGECGGEYSMKSAAKRGVYKGDDPVEEVLFNLSAASGGRMTTEQATLTMLLRIEKALNRKNAQDPKGR